MATPVLALTARRVLVLVLAVIAALAATTLLTPSSASAKIAPEARQGAVRGIDVSGHQHPEGRDINFAKVRRAGYTFAFIKATEGRTFVNEYATSDGRASVRAGLKTGFYHFARPSTSARTQARFFAEQVRRTGVKEPMLVLDLEANDGRSAAHVRAWTRNWLRSVEHLTGERPIIYSSASFWEGSVRAGRAFAHYPLWVAHYETRRPAIPEPWGAYSIWQHSATGRVPGVPGLADVNVSPRPVLNKLASDTVAGTAKAPAASGRASAPAVSRSGARPAVKAAPKKAAAKPAPKGAAATLLDGGTGHAPVPDFLTKVRPLPGTSFGSIVP